MKKKMLIIIVYLYVTNVFSSDIGINVHPNRYALNNSSLVSNLDYYGFNSIRVVFPWDWIEKSKNRYEMIGGVRKIKELTDSVYYENKSNLIVLAYGNNNYTPTGFPENSQQVEGFSNYAYFLSSQLKGKAKYYEIWNEWTYGTGVENGKYKVPSLDKYFYLVKETSIKIRLADPNAIILAGAINPLNQRDFQWFDNLIDMGILKYIDGVSIHPYSFMERDKSVRKPTNNFKKIEEFESFLVRKTGKIIPLYITEMGIPTYNGEGGMQRLDVARFVFKYTLLTSSKSYIKGIWWYDYSDDGLKRLSKEDNFGFFDYYHKPKSAALAIKIISDMGRTYDIYSSNISNDNVVELVLKNKINKDVRKIKWKDAPGYSKEALGKSEIYQYNDVISDVPSITE